jgi:RNA polymerase sigma-70 factor (ECF subfamily)
VSEGREAELDALMSRLAAGDRSAFAPLYASLRPRARRLVARRRGAAHADDVAQLALLKVFARASDFTPGRPCLPWFYAIVANEIQASRRRDARHVPAEIADDALADDRDPERELADRELLRALEVAIASLDEPSAKAIAALLGRAPMPEIPPATFRKRLSRAYAKLRLLLGGQDAR